MNVVGGQIMAEMIKYYYVSRFKYEYGIIVGEIFTYYLTQDGYIKEEDYKDDFNDPYYKHEYNQNRASYCCLSFDKEEMYISLDEAKKELSKRLENFYKEQSLKLLNAYNKFVKEHNLGDK